MPQLSVSQKAQNNYFKNLKKLVEIYWYLKYIWSNFDGEMLNILGFTLILKGSFITDQCEMPQLSIAQN